MVFKQFLPGKNSFLEFTVVAIGNLFHHKPDVTHHALQNAMMSSY